MNDEQRAFINKHDQKAIAVQESLGSMYKEIERIDREVEDKLEKYMQQINIKLSSIATQQKGMMVSFAKINTCLFGNEGCADGVVHKVNKHDMWFYIVYGMLILCGFAIANVGLYIK